jgi:hypothetical protein
MPTAAPTLSQTPDAQVSLSGLQSETTLFIAVPIIAFAAFLIFFVSKRRQHKA